MSHVETERERETKTEIERGRASQREREKMMVSVAGRFLAMHISILPVKAPLNLSGGVEG